jgi:hypothetical protein
MPLPRYGQRKLTCASFGPGPCGHHLTNLVDELLSRPSGWLCYNAHGVDGEGWGPLSADTLVWLLERLSRRRGVRVLPPAAALNLATQ